MINVVSRALLCVTVCTLMACTSSGPATSYYSLFASQRMQPLNVALPDISLGIGPIVLPEYLENPAIVSLSASQKVRVSGYHAWAGDLKEAMTRVIAQDVSSALGLGRVWAFPWDNRVGPQYQVRIVFEEFSGIRGQSVHLRAKWRLLNQRGDKVLAFSSEKIVVDTATESVDDYVNGLNNVLSQLALSVAEGVAEHLK